MKKHDLVVIGAGPGGYVAAIRAAQLGLDVACIDEHALLGGTCLRVGCIPSKALLESSERYESARTHFDEHGIEAVGVKLNLARMLERKEKVVEQLTRGIGSLFKKNGITHYHGRGRFEGEGAIVVERDGERVAQLVPEHTLIATGSKPAALPGVECDGDRIGTSTEALAYAKVPKHLVVIGAGYIGLELGTVWRRLGAEVTVLEYLDRILPGMDAEIAAYAQKTLAQQGLTFRLQERVTGARRKGRGCEVTCADGEPIGCDRVLLATGRVPNTDGLGLDAIGLTLDKRGFIPVDEHFHTAAHNVFAIGDVIGGAMLAHKAEEEGVACVERLATGCGHVHYDAIPGVVYTYPEIASVGRTEEQLKDAGTAYRKGAFDLRGNGRARALGDCEGRVKILADATTDRILGVHIIGPRAGDLIAEAVAAISFGASAEDIARMSHAHPTLAEAVKEAALAVDGRALHA